RAALAADGDGHVAAEQEGEPAEDLLLGHVRPTADQAADPRCQFLVVGHGAIVDQRTSPDMVPTRSRFRSASVRALVLPPGAWRCGLGFRRPLDQAVVV